MLNSTLLLFSGAYLGAAAIMFIFAEDDRVWARLLRGAIWPVVLVYALLMKETDDAA